MPNVFVYGTLRKGERNHHYLDGASCIFQQCWTYGALYDTNSDYPVIKESAKEKVFGELYKISESNLTIIDRLEGYVDGDSDNLYNRKNVPVFDDRGKEHKGIIYTAGNSLSNSTKKIPSGDWSVHNYLKRDSLLYFAYGSCMDNERFQKAGVEQYFRKEYWMGLRFNFPEVRKTAGKQIL
ncbi:gamma-glutamylcyclotransferase family protein [Virgibacillus doumboii]|uniref:gamma-glutamylcyclotransferase family protein n=1 Tax=Virgibacillus doumboii TaxID=2697503 RepID=UPI0013DEA0C2|nr:gamma-glutamylcyclotransferase family protein [Virgibacillus doumboii]